MHWGPPVGVSCITNVMCIGGLVVLAWLGDENATPILSLIYAVTYASCIYAWLTVQMLWQMHGSIVHAVYTLTVCVGMF